MIWDKVGFVLASRQRQEIFKLIKECKTIKEIEGKAKITNNARRILKDFEKEGLIKVENVKVELTEIGKEVAKKLPKFFQSI
jgi:predicted transcriptional regulator